MRRLLAGWIVVALAAGAVVAVRGDETDAAAHYLPDVLPMGYVLQDARVAQPGSTLATPLSYRRVLLRRPGDRVVADFVAAPADPDRRGAAVRGLDVGQARPFPGGMAFVSQPDDGAARVWWSTSRRSGLLLSTTVPVDELLAMARRFARTGFGTPPGWKGLGLFDADSAIEVVDYHPQGSPELLQVLVHRRRPLPAGHRGSSLAQHEVDEVTVSVVSSGADVPVGDLRAIAGSVRRVDAATWRRALDAVDLDGRAVRWEELASGRASTNAGWSLAVEDRGGQRCLALLIVERALDPRASCGVATWRSDPVLAVPTDRSGPAAVTAAGHRLRPLGEARFDGRRILVVELPAELWGQVIDPVAVVSRR